jgi:hypothetical protein
MRRLLPIVMLLAVAAPAAASTPASRHSSARVTACAADPATSEYSATFTGTMRRYRHAAGLEMRFALYTRSAAVPHWTHAASVGGFDNWIAANAGVTKYISDKSVHPLAPGASYRALIHYRWRNAKGKIVARATHLTPLCHAPDRRANLKVKKITARPADATGMRTYVVKVLNNGGTSAPVFMTGLAVNNAVQPDRSSGAELAPGASTLVSFAAPACAPGSTVTATADTGGAVDERDESDNALSVACP